MTTDRELLEQAAKAAGIQATWDEMRGTMHHPHQSGVTDCYSHDWNPLEDDGDALRLAVTLQMRVATYDGFTVVRMQVDGFVQEEHDGDALAATRRAIVRAAGQALHHRGRLLEEGPEDYSAEKARSAPRRLARDGSRHRFLRSPSC